MKQYEKLWLERFNELINNNITNVDFQLTDISIALGISRAKLYRRLIKLTGQAPSDYIRNKRLGKAFEILDRGVYPTVKETAAAVGFRQPEHFTRVFFKEYDILPSELLKQ